MATDPFGSSCTSTLGEAMRHPSTPFVGCSDLYGVASGFAHPWYHWLYSSYPSHPQIEPWGTVA
eukprot:2272098-Lingulodinium_polyedra.AAC.1